MTRLLIDTKLLGDDLVELEGEYHHKLSRVLKLKKGEKVELIDGRGNVYETEVSNLSKAKTSLKILNKEFITKPKTEITLAQAIAKGDRFDYVIQKVTELGVSKIIPIITKRTVVKIPTEKERSKVERWREIARHAIEQSGQAWLPDISNPQPLEFFLNNLQNSDLKIIFYEEEREKKLRDIWPSSIPKSILALIGPEGGFDYSEVKQSKNVGFISVSLGSIVLRTDTVPIVALSLIKYLTSALG